MQLFFVSDLAPLLHMRMCIRCRRRLICSCGSCSVFAISEVLLQVESPNLTMGHLNLVQPAMVPPRLVCGDGPMATFECAPAPLFP
mmetsp:Transcript_57900/g.120306  ORF Transcript_57900/g.120306 Transcript_57900/m.120306 type:complete len:86 (+) Transcript_57900:272-529(+)